MSEKEHLTVLQVKQSGKPWTVRSTVTVHNHQPYPAGRLARQLNRRSGGPAEALHETSRRDVGSWARK
jgi:hypothetical protein